MLPLSYNIINSNMYSSVNVTRKNKVDACNMVFADNFQRQNCCGNMLKVYEQTSNPRNIVAQAPVVRMTFNLLTKNLTRHPLDKTLIRLNFVYPAEKVYTEAF